MFDFGFSKLLLLGIVALVVIGPERLPRVARTLGHLYGRLQRYVTQVKADIHREMEVAELGKMKTEFETAARSFQSEIESQAAAAEREIRDARTSIDRSLADVAPEADLAPASALAAPSPQLELDIEEPASPAPGSPAPGKPAA